MVIFLLWCYGDVNDEENLLKSKISFCAFPFFFPPQVKSTENSPSCDVHLTGSVDFLLRLLRCEESVVDYEVVHLRDFLCQCVVLSQESQQLFARSVDGQLFRQEIFVFQHVLKEDFSKTASLTRFVNIEVQDTWSVNMTGFAVFVKYVERFAANFEETNDETTADKLKILVIEKISRHKNKSNKLRL